MKSASDILKILYWWIKKALWDLGLNAFWVILMLVLIDIALGTLIFYQYVYLAEREQPRVIENILKFNDKAYQNVLLQLQAKEQGDIVNQQPPIE